MQTLQDAGPCSPPPCNVATLLMVHVVQTNQWRQAHFTCIGLGQPLGASRTNACCKSAMPIQAPIASPHVAGMSHPCAGPRAASVEQHSAGGWDVATEDAFLRTKVPGGVRSKVVLDGGSYSLTIALGGPSEVTCELLTEARDLATLMARSAEITFGRIEKQNGTDGGGVLPSSTASCAATCRATRTWHRRSRAAARRLHRARAAHGGACTFGPHPCAQRYGVALVFAEGPWQANGHAWAQTHEDGQWVLRDSALGSLSALSSDLPATVVDDEGPGHKLAILRSIGRMPSRNEWLQGHRSENGA